MSIKHDHTLSPVTGLGFYSTSAGHLLLLIGEGSYLKVYDTERSALLAQCQIFHEQAIHGIVVNESVSQPEELEIVIWGGNCLTLLSKKDGESILSLDVRSLINRCIAVSDWILDVVVSEYEKDSCILVTAHNALLRAKLRSNGQKSAWERLPSPSESIIYSAHVVRDTSDRLLVAAGTVFGEIIVWEGLISTDGVFGNIRTLFTITGHEGSIFGVNLSPPLNSLLCKGTRLLISCSDDRTIRLWDLSPTTTQAAAKASPNSHRETGFEGIESSSISHSGSRCLAIAMGHSSRIWGVKFAVDNLSCAEQPKVNVLSFGEDSATQLWELKLEEASEGSKVSRSYKDLTSIPDFKPTTTLNHVGTFSFHSGKQIWSSVIRKNSNGAFNLATGGADGKVSLYTVPECGSKPQLFCQEIPNLVGATSLEIYDTEKDSLYPDSWHLEEILKCLMEDQQSPVQITQQVLHDHPRTSSLDGGHRRGKKKKTKKIPKDALNRYAFVSQDSFIFTTTFGRVLMGKVGGSPDFKGISLPDSRKDDLKSYSIVIGIPEISVAFLAGGNGRIFVYSHDSCEATVVEFGEVEGKAADMFSTYNRKNGTHYLLVTTLLTRIATLFPVQPADGNATSPNTVLIELPENFVVTGAGICNNLLILGSREGSLAVYDVERSTLLYIWNDYDTNVRDAITTILPLFPPSSTHDDSSYFLTAGRNGMYSVFVLRIDLFIEAAENAALYPVHRGTPPFKPVIESAWIDGSDLILCGFKSTKFIVWNETKQFEVTSIECGGAHRGYAYLPLTGGSGIGSFIYTKASKLYIHSQISPSHQITKEGGHGREIKSSAISPDKKLIATGAEDTAIRIWHYTDQNEPFHNQFSCLAVVQKHTAGVQHLQWYNPYYLFSSGGNEEFFIWAISDIPRFGIGVICEATCLDRSSDCDLRIMSFDVTSAPESFALQGEDALLITLAYSDSTVRIYKYTKSTSFILIGTGKYTSSCLTQVKHVSISNNILFLLTASTDGSLPIWKLPLRPRNEDEDEENSFMPSPPRLELVSTSKIHQNAIKSLDLMKFERGGFWLVVTGGDDNAIALSIYSSERISERPRSFILRSAHAAAVTGVSILPRVSFKEKSWGFRVVSSGNDQRVKEWSITVSSGAKECAVDIEKTGDVFTAVADVGDVVLLRSGNCDEKVLIVGNGMEVWNVAVRG